MQTQWHWRNRDFFEGIEEEKERFLAHAQRVEMEKNSIIFFEGDSGGACYYIASGLVRIFSVSDSGKEPIFFLRKTGEMFGLSEVLDQSPRKANAQTLVPSVLYRMDVAHFESLLAASYPLTRRVITMLGARIRYLGDYVSNLMTCNVKIRLAKLLLALVYDSLPNAEAWSQPVELPMRVSQEQLASMTGSTQPTISELMQELQLNNIVSLSRRQLVILNPLALHQLAEKGEL